MMNDYLKSRAYYADKYLNKNPDYEFKVTDPMKVGMAVDIWLTESKKAFDKKYCRKFERTVKRFKRTVKKTDDKELFEAETILKNKQDVVYDKESKIIEDQIKNHDEENVLSSTIYDKALQVAEYVAKQPFWYTNVDDAYFQIPLEGEVEGLQVCGLPDRIDPLGETHYHLTDLKVVSAMKNSSPKKWFWNAQEMGYLRQLALYQYLWAQKQGVPVTNIMCSHSTASYIQPGITRVALFRVPQAVLDIAMEEVREIARNIKDENFDDKLVTWNQAQKIGYENDNKEQDLSDWDAVEDAGGNERFIKS